MNNRFRSVWFQSFKCPAIVLLLVFFSASLKAQTLNYEAFIKDEKIGEVQVVREINDEAERFSLKGFYRIYTDSLTQFHFESRSAYMDGRLKESEAFTSFNGDKESSISIWQKGEHYLLKNDSLDFVLPVLVEEIFGLDLFFFEEPKGISHSFSLLSGDKYWMESVCNHAYRVKKLNQDKSTDRLFIKPYHTFEYENGILKQYSDAFNSTIITMKLKE